MIAIAVGSIVANKRASATPKDRTDRMLGVHVEVACDFEDDGRESMCERNVFCRRSIFFRICIPSADGFESLRKRDDVGSRKAASDLFHK